VSQFTRRQFGLGLVTLGVPVIVHRPGSDGAPPSRLDLPAGFPAQDPTLVREVVGASHGNLARVRDVVEAQPALAKAAWDWGFGDWETALGAAAHTGRREIAELLLAHGARPTLFSAAMLGQLDVVRAFIEATPGIQRTPGPHGLTLMVHARAGGPQAAEVARYLDSVGGADDRPVSAPLDPAVRDSLVGVYAYGPAEREAVEATVDRDTLWLAAVGGVRRGLTHVGQLSFFPAGAPAVRITFARERDRGVQVTIVDGPVRVAATRRP
jgi:hypothetical protein